jgi:hypothetical protein
MPYTDQAARASWLAPLIAIGVSVFTVQIRQNNDDPMPGMIVACAIILIILAGFVFGLFAFVSAFVKGYYSALVPATIGLVINGLIVFVIGSSLVAAAQVALQHKARQMPASTEWIPTGSGWYIDREREFAAQFPPGWDVKKDALRDVAVAVLSPRDSDSDTVVENIVVATEPIPASITCAVWTDKNLANMRTGVEGFEETGDGALNINGLESTWISYKHTSQGVVLHTTSYFVANNRRGYCITCAAAPDTTDRYREPFLACVQSLKIPSE